MTSHALVVVEPRGGDVPLGQLGVLSAVARVATSVEVLLPIGADEDVESLTHRLGRHGASVVRSVAGLPGTAAPLVAVVADLQAQESYDLVALENSSLAADVAGALAVRLGAGVCWDLVGLDEVAGELVGRRLALADSTVVDVGWVGGPAVALFRTSALDPVETPAADPPRVLPLEAPVAAGPDVTLRETTGRTESGRSGLDGADVVVAGGRGLGSVENIALIEELAAELGGVVGVSMPVVDRGWYPYAHQVGQTGRIVRPRLYVACGISGAVQHRVGMSRSGTVVAINTDPQAPIFDVCDLGVVGDLTDVVPRITALLRERAGS